MRLQKTIHNSTLKAIVVIIPTKEKKGGKYLM
jgi:hypothetical protein